MVETKTSDQLVDEIHKIFDTAGDRIISQAQQIIKECSEQLTSRGEKLLALGFTNTPEARAVQELRHKVAIQANFLKDALYI